MSKITIINYGAGNLLSVKNMLKKAGANEVLISDRSDEIADAEQLILPGVGHFDFGMKSLKSSGLIPVIEKKVFEDKTPILGICLGAQLMTQSSDEGSESGLGWVEAKTVAFDKMKFAMPLKVPHMGWNDVNSKKDCTLFKDMHTDPRFYFVHSYHFQMDHAEDIWLETEYGYKFCAAFQRDNIYSCQFHPEKSHKFGLQLMKNFVELTH
jgi:glutamine amidotransferase